MFTSFIPPGTGVGARKKNALADPPPLLCSCLWTMGPSFSPSPGGRPILQLWIDDQQVAGSPQGKKEDQCQEP